MYKMNTNAFWKEFYISPTIKHNSVSKLKQNIETVIIWLLLIKLLLIKFLYPKMFYYSF